MCIICVDFQKQLLTINEARGVLTEMVDSLDREHVIEIYEVLEKAEDDS
jgi:hypothetical protein